MGFSAESVEIFKLPHSVEVIKNIGGLRGLLGNDLEVCGSKPLREL